MYKEFFGLTRFPFHNTPDPAFFFNSRSHSDALASMVYGIQEGKGFILVTGDVGAGKTMLVQALKRELGEQHILIEIANPWITPEEVLAAVRQRVDVATPGDTALLEALKQRLSALAEEGKRVVLVIDEAHQLPERTLEGIRLLSNIETSTEKLLQIVLLGQDELASLLGRYSMRQLQQRIALNYHLQRLNSKETAEYIQHRLRVAGGTPLLFPPDCIELIHQESMGSPRVINQLCDNCLLFAFGRRSPQVTVEIVGDAIANLHPERRGPAASPQIIPDSLPAMTVTAAAPAAPTPPPASPPSTASTYTPPPFPLPNVAPTPAPLQGTAGLSPNNEVPLPFELPSTRRHEQSEGYSEGKNGGLGLKHILLALALGLGVGALGLWYLQGQMGVASLLPALRADAKAGGQAAAKALPAASGGAISMAPPEKASTDPASGSLPAAPAAAGTPPGAAAIRQGMPNSEMPSSAIPLPGSAAAYPLPTREISISAQGGISMQATNHFGAWNETVRDLIVASNPGLADLENLAPGSKVKLPILTRENLIVRDTDGRFHVYFGSFDKAEEARLNLEAMRRSWNGAQLVAAKRLGVPTQRLFIGAFASQAEAQAVANTLWFKHLPALN